MDRHTYLGNIDIQALDSLYHQYIQDPSSVEESWRKFFEGFEFARNNYHSDELFSRAFDKEFKVLDLIEGYRRRGHLFTRTNPVRTRRTYTPTLDLENYGLSGSDLDTVFQAGKDLGIGPATLREIVSHLQQTYCQSIGVEYLFIRKPEIVGWLQRKMESTRNTPVFTPEEKKHIYYHLKLAVGFEQFIHRKFVGQKRFSLEGAESLIPALDAVIERGSELGIEEFVIGMAHRGRLNILANVLKKPYESIFREFNAQEYEEDITLGDVKYHLGYGNTIIADNGKRIKLNLAPNPSHLEAVGPVVQGIAHARIQEKYQDDFNRLAAIVIHGDAAIAAQGVVYETLQMSNLPGYTTGGTIHLVINNQVGFTTNYLDARSSTYCTDIGKVTKSPIFHVNGDDVEALIYTIQLALEYRSIFHTDVFVDILCYRRYGHNEGDEPRFTQPLLYKQISKHPNPRDIYAKKLVDSGIYTLEQVKALEKEYEDLLEEKLAISKESPRVTIQRFLKDEWKGYVYAKNGEVFNPVSTGVNRDSLLRIARQLNHLPVDKKFFSKISKLVEDREKMIGENRVDWAMAELLAYATLAVEGHPVRLSGQDSERGTFSHRHAAFLVEDSDEKYIPLEHLEPGQARVRVINSPLSEYGVLGFEYGVALAVPNGLTIWEAQFGDFHNVAQVIIDQYISSAEEKWGLMNGLMMLLPHGFEGQGPEHSSGRIERFLTMAAGNNMQIVNCTTPANFYHLTRRQVKRNFRIPLIVFTPKSLLRHPRCMSGLDELTTGGFHEVIDDPASEPGKTTQVVFCYGKLYYELLEKKEESGSDHVALVRVEQLHPFPIDHIRLIISRYHLAKRFVWAQEEPENMGAWSYVHRVFNEVPLLPVCRPASGSPATGLNYIHKQRQKKIIDKIFGYCTCGKIDHYCGMQCDKHSNQPQDIEKTSRTRV